jgi:hypothetical protein
VVQIINSFHYLCCEVYSKLLVDHRLSSLLNVCDGPGTNAQHKKASVEGGIEYVPTNLDVKLVKEGAAHVGIREPGVHDTLADTHNEIDHHAPQTHGIGWHMADSRGVNSAYTRFGHVLRMAPRVALLGQVGVDADPSAKDTALKNVVDWVIMRSGIGDECYLAANECGRLVVEA